MKISYQDAMETPASIMLRDLEYLELEGKYLTPKVEEINKK